MKKYLFLILFFCLINVNATTYNFDITYSTPLKVINFSYGLQNDGPDAVDAIYTPSTIGPLMNNATSSNGYNRIWIKGRAYTGGLINIPLSNASGDNCVHYNYTNLTAQINFTLNNDMKPLLLFAHVPECWTNLTTSTCSSAFPNVPYYDNFYNYTRDVVKYYYDICTNGTMTNCNDFSTWQWEIWNEPGCGGHSVDDYTNLIYIPVQQKIKAIVPSANVSSAGSVGTTLAAEIDEYYGYLNSSTYPERFSVHFYDNAEVYDPTYTGTTYNGSSATEFLQGTQYTYFTRINQKVTQVNGYRAGTLLYNDEYSLSGDSTPAWTNFVNLNIGSAWMASALYWQIQTNMTGDVYYKSTDFYNLTPTYTVGLWKINSSLGLTTLKPIYYTRASFVDNFSSGNNLYIGNSTETSVEVASTDNSILIINKYNNTNTISLNFYGKNITGLTKNNNFYGVVSNQVSLNIDAFASDFYEIDTGLSCVNSGIITCTNVCYNDEHACTETSTSNILACTTTCI